MLIPIRKWLKQKIPRVPPDIRENLRQELMKEAELDTEFMVLTVTSCFIATLGLLMNSAAVIIGAMLIAPLMLPLRGLALGVLDTDRILVRSSLFNLLMGTLMAILISGVVGGFFGVPEASFGSEILGRTQPNLADLGVAVAAGAISGFAKIRRKLSDALAGTAISVALMPPLCVVGIALSQKALPLASGAFLLYLTNFLGITLSCIIIFILGGYYLNYNQTSQALSGFVAMTGILVFPLFISFGNLLRQERFEGQIKTLLENKTVTVGQQSELVGLKVKWPTFPWSKDYPIILVTVQENTKNPITPTQVGLVEKLVKKELGKKFKLVFRVSQLREVVADYERPLSTPQLFGPMIPPPVSPLPPHELLPFSSSEDRE
ncbi:TIGR00341 family protein [Crocosphaera sp.]|uniref:TIGR00341 family protein n=1 Tax=Crocosphaera sp. TaxID=2729996 RepID=UPI003F25671B|nr:TIGR00341 family protein [Crocosphaera sp.]